MDLLYYPHKNYTILFLLFQYANKPKDCSIPLFIFYLLDSLLFLFYNGLMNTIQNIPINDQKIIISESIGFSMQLLNDRALPLHNHDYYEIFYVLDGEIQHTLNGNTQTLSIGDCYLITPLDSHAIVGNGSSLRDFLISRTIFEDILRLVTHSENPLIFCNKETNSVRFSVSELMELEAIALHYSSTAELIRKRGLGTELLIKVFNKFFKLIDNETPSDSPVTQKILDLLNTSAGIQGGIPFICEALQYSESYIYHCFKYHMGVTLSQYLKDIRLKYIEYYLKTSNYSLQTIANLVGLESLSYLNRIFKEKYAMTPIKFKKRYANPSPPPPKKAKRKGR